MVLTAGEAEIRDGLGGTEGGGHLESGRSQFFKKNNNKKTPTFFLINTQIDIYIHTDSDAHIACAV